MVVGEIRVVEAKFADKFELPPHGRKRLDQSKAADFHEDRWWVGIVKLNQGFVGAANRRQSFSICSAVIGLE